MNKYQARETLGNIGTCVGVVAGIVAVSAGLVFFTEASAFILGVIGLGLFLWLVYVAVWGES
jgi:ammonia channel protein AmtB